MPDACLVNFYGPDAKMGQHRDADELDLKAPVLSVSLGDSAVFRLGGLERTAPTTTVKLHSGDVCLLKGEARLAEATRLHERAAQLTARDAVERLWIELARLEV